MEKGNSNSNVHGGESLAARLSALRQSGLNVSPKPPAPFDHLKPRTIAKSPLSLGSLPPSPTPPTPAAELTPTEEKQNLMNDVMADTLREWNSLLKKLLMQQKYETYQKIKGYIDQLYQLRKKVTSASSEQELALLQQEVDSLVGLKMHASNDSLRSLASSPSLASADSRPPTPRSSDTSMSVSDLYKRHAFADSGFWLQSAYLSSQNLEEEAQAKRRSFAEVNVQSFHVYFTLKACIASICGPGETSELAFSIYNKTKGKFVTENYLVRLTFNGMPKEEDKIGRLRTIFADLSKSDLSNELFLVCKIVRSGRMVLPGEKEMNSGSLPDDYSNVSSPFRRPFGYAVLDLSEILANCTTKEDQDHLMRIYTTQNESNFPLLLDNIINKNGGYETSSRAETICIGVDLYQGRLETVIREHFAYVRDIEVTSRLGFPDIILPGDDKNSMYITLNGGEFTQGRKTSAKNVEVCVQACHGDGSYLDNCFFSGTGEYKSGSYESIVYYHNNSPKWMETFRFDMPLRFSDMYMLFMLRHCSSSDNNSRNGSGDKADKTFAFGILPLMRDDGTLIPDELHSLSLYKYDKKSFNEFIVGLKTSVNSVIDDSKLVSLGKDKLIVRSELCSTQMTQNVALMKLLKWKTVNVEDMRHVLKNFTFIGPLEIIKYLQDILHSLFEIMQESTESASRSILCLDPEIPHIVFSALVFVLNIIVTDRRFSNFRPILDVYVRDHYTKYHVHSVWKSLLYSINYLLANPDDPALAKELRSTLKASEFLFKLIVKSWISAGGLLLKEHQRRLKEDVTSFFNGISRMFAGNDSTSNSDVLIGAQILVLQNLTAIVSELIPTSILKPNELSQICVKFLKCHNGEKKKLLDSKINLACQLVKKDFFKKDKDSQLGFFQALSDLIIFCLDNHSDLLPYVNRLIIQIVDHKQSEDFSFDRIFPRMISLFMGQLSKKNSRIETTEDELVLETEFSVCMLAMIECMKEDALVKAFVAESDKLDSFVNLTSFWLNSEKTSKDSSLSDKVSVRSSKRGSKISEVSGNDVPVIVIKTVGPFPETWTSIIKSFYSVMFKYLLCLEMVLEMKKVRSFGVIILSDLLALSSQADGLHLPEDFYVSADPLVATLVQKLWSGLDSEKLASLKLIIEFTALSKYSLVKESCINILVELLKNEESRYHLSSITATSSSKVNFIESAKSLTPLQVEIIDQLDRLILGLGKCDITYTEWLVTKLKQNLNETAAFSCFIKSVEKFVSLTLYVRSLQQIDSSNDELFSAHHDDYAENNYDFASESHCEDLSLILSHLLHFTAVLDRKPMYIKYIHILFNLHLKNGNIVEAAHTLKLHCDLYKFESKEEIESLDQNFDLLKNMIDGPNHNQNCIFDGLVNGDLFSNLSTRQKQQERKECLVLLTIALFQKAQIFEEAISEAKTLATYYSEIVFDYKKAARIYQVIADLSLSLNDTDRFYPSYFKVAFVGKGWHSFFKGENKNILALYGDHFIMKGNVWESLGEFVERMISKYDPQQVGDIKILKQTSYPPDSQYTQSEDKYLQICKVDPVADCQLFGHFLCPDDVPSRVRNFYENNLTKQFLITRPCKKPNRELSSIFNEKSPEYETVTTWIEEYVLETENKFPYFLRTSKVVNCTKREISPIENAIKAIENKNRELEQLEKTFKFYTEAKQKAFERGSLKRKSLMTKGAALGQINVNPLTMSLNGAVDAPVNGGIPAYKNAFFNEKYMKLEDKGLVANLRESIHRQVSFFVSLISLTFRLLL